MYQLALVGEDPTVVGTGEESLVPVVNAADPVAAVHAPVQKRVERTLTISAEDDRIGADVCVQKVVGRGHEALMADHVPRAAEDLDQFLLVDVGIDEDAGVQGPVVGVDDLVPFREDHGRLLSDRSRPEYRWVDRD